MNNTSRVEALEALTRSWPRIVEECRGVLGSELHYQAVIYHCLRSVGKVQPRQLGMNVKIWISDAVSELFRGGREPIPDLVIFSPDIAGDFRRRNYANTLRRMLLAAEIKISERFQGRLQAGEIVKDILKLEALHIEAQARDADLVPAVIIVDTAPEEIERMGSWALREARDAASSRGMCFFIFRQKTSSLIFQRNWDLRNEIWQVAKTTGSYRQAMSEVTRSCLMNAEQSSAKDSAGRVSLVQLGRYNGGERRGQEIFHEPTHESDGRRSVQGP